MIRSNTRITIATALLAALPLATGCTSASPPRPAAAALVWKGERLSVDLPGGTATVDATTLAVRYASGSAGFAWSAPAFLAKKVTGHSTHDGKAEWTVNGYHVTASVVDGRLRMQADTNADSTLTWPVTAVDEATKSIEFANGSGQTVPVDDPFWLSEKSGLPGSEWQLAGDVTMPFWGTTFAAPGAKGKTSAKGKTEANGQTGAKGQAGARGQAASPSGVAYIVPTDIDTTLSFAAKGGRLQAAATHEFSRAAGTSHYEVDFAATDGSPVASAIDYRKYLQGTTGITTLDEKIKANPEVAKLTGAQHAYGWGDGRSSEIVARLEKLGVDRLWLGYDADGSPMTAEAVARAKKAGYVVAPYDTWENAQDPADSDTESSVWPAPLWPDGCALDAKGEPVAGFGGRGCELSSTALGNAQASSGVLTDRAKAFAKNGVNGYFVDVDAVGQLVRDFSPVHGATKADDRSERLKRLGSLTKGELSGGDKFVVGSETAAAWANGVVSYSHGSATALTGSLWKLEGEPATWGGYWPEDRPAFFFKNVDLPADTAKAMFDPRYLVPLYETVLHDSVVSTDRWELGVFKFPAVTATRILTSLLRNDPVMLALDSTVLEQHGDEIAALQKVFATLQKAAGTKALTAFDYLDAEHLVQRTRFGSSLEVTANFGATPSNGVAPGCLVAKPAGAAAIDYCPS